MYNFNMIKISILLSLTLIFSPLLSNIGMASSIDNVNGSEFKVIEVDNLEEYLTINSIDPLAFGTVTLIVAGIVVGIIVDGVIIYATGQSGGEWVSDALSYFARYVGRVKNIFCDYYNVTHIEDNSGCVMRAGTNRWDCPYFY